MNTFHKIILLATILGISQKSQSQFYIGASVGQYELQDNVPAITKKEKGFSLKTGYVKMFSKEIGLGLGLEYVEYNQNVLPTSNFSSATYLVDSVNSAFEYRLNVTQYEEQQNMSALQIPLFIQYKTLVNKGIYLYTRVGAKYMMPQKFETSATASKVTVSGYYPDFNLLITDLPSRGFGTQTGYSQTGTYATTNVFLGSLEFGFIYPIAKKSKIYVGLYIDKSTKSIIANNDKNSIIGFNPNEISNRPVNGIYSINKSVEVKPLNFGLTISYGFE